jgi:hypothetical protein
MNAPEVPAAMSADRADAPASTAADAIATRDVTETRTMPIACEADGCTTPPAPEQPRPRRPADPRVKSARRSRPQRWRDAVAELLALQTEYAKWLAALPDSLSDSQTAEALEAIVDLDLTELADIEPPRGYGRD